MSFPNNTSHSLSVVIVSYNVCDYVLDGIASLYKFCNFPLQVILVDNNSQDKTVELVKSQFPQVTIIENKTNRGFSAANNQGFKICKNKYVLLFNPDALLIDDSINLLLNELDIKNNQFVLMAPKLVNTDNSYQTSCWKFPNPWQHLLELFFLNQTINITNYPNEQLCKICKVDFVSGAFILLSKKTLDVLGGLDENLFWMDDVDFCKRNLEIGGENLYVPVAIAKHHIGQSAKKNYHVVISNQIISKLKFYKKHKQLVYFLFSIPIFLLQILSRIPLFFVLGGYKRVYFLKSRAYLYTLGKLLKYLFLNKQNVI